MNKNMAKKILTEPKMNYDLNLLQDMYKKMLLIRRFEEKAGQLYGMGQIGGFCHLYIGQEAVVVGIQSAQIDGDSIVTSYREKMVIQKVRVVPCICSVVKRVFLVAMVS